MAFSVQELASDWKVLGSKPGEDKGFTFFMRVHTGPGTYTATCTMGTKIISGGGG
jgi:hypothetical protein